VADVALGHARVSGREVLIEAAFSIQRLTGFADSGAPIYDTRTEKRTLRVLEGSSAAIPVLVANRKETDEFRVRELFLKFRARAGGSSPPVEYGEIALKADIPRAEIFLDGGFVGRTSFEGPVLLSAVRVGEREIIIRDASGREGRTVARVGKGHRTNLSLTLLKSPAASTNGLRPLGRNPQGQEEFWREKDGAIVVRIPGGEFQMGSPEGEGERSEHPRHAVRVKGVLMDKTEVTWGQYRRFAAESGQSLPQAPIWGMPEALPASGIIWTEARAFCDWAGGRLPTEAEWERAARGDDTRRYPWGDIWAPWRCNTRDGGPHAPTPAGAYPDSASPFGVLDLAGSVSEWCSDWYEADYYAKSPQENPTGPEKGETRVSRGGFWMSPSFSARVTSREGTDPGWRNPMRGFRCVQDDLTETKK
jgi:formylglycine-generating enzyme required for sulfatase activity